MGSTTGFKRIVRSGFIGFWRNAFVSLSSIFVMTITLLVVVSVILSNQLLETALLQIQNKVDINVYMVTSADEARVLALKSSLESLPDVREVVYTSREKALTEFREKHKADEPIIQGLDELGENPLRASLAVRAVETGQYEAIAAFLDEQRAGEDPADPLIDKTNFPRHKEAIDKLTAIIGTTDRATTIAMFILIIATVLITFNTIRLAIYTSRDEISVMRLVGASNMFIRGPFMLQGVMYGLISGVLALLIIYPVVLWLGPATAEFFEYNLFNYFVSDFGKLFGIVVGSGVILGIVSSLLAVARYLRV